MLCLKVLDFSELSVLLAKHFQSVKHFNMDFTFLVSSPTLFHLITRE